MTFWNSVQSTTRFLTPVIAARKRQVLLLESILRNGLSGGFNIITRGGMAVMLRTQRESRLKLLLQIKEVDHPSVAALSEHLCWK